MYLMNSHPPCVSLVVATLGRRQEVVRLLTSIPSEHYPEIEIVVVDQNVEDLQPELASLPQGLKIQHLPVGFCNASAARNLGAERATGSWLIFPDDDALFLPDTLAEAMQWMQTERFDLISGRIVDGDGRPHLLQWLPDAAEITHRTIEQTFVESAFFIRRTLFLDAGGFDPLFGPGGQFPSAEGADLVYRLWRETSVPSRYEPSIALYHPSKHTPRTAAARQRIHDFAMGEGAFLLRHFRVLPLLTIGRKLLFRSAGTLISSGETRLRKIAYLKGFFLGSLQYHRSLPSPIAFQESLDGGTAR